MQNTQRESGVHYSTVGRVKRNRQSVTDIQRYFQVKYVNTPIPIVSSIWSTIIT
jgi:hypothetical protein